MVSNTSNVSITNKRKAKVFLFTLLLTSILWLLIELSKSYTSSVVFIVEYKNLPEGKLIQSNPISELNVAINTSGFKLLKYKVKKEKVNLSLRNVIKSTSNYYLLPNQQIAFLNAQLRGGTEVVNVLSDTVFIELGVNKSKKVPIKTSIEINYKLGYNLIKNIKMKPDSVIVTGPEKYIDSIKELITNPLKLNDVYKNIDEELYLQLPSKSTKVIASVNKVNIIGKVDKFTEGSFKIPVTVINEPIGVKINSFPKEIEIVYQVGLSNFNKITTNSILVVFDYNQYKKDTLVKYLTPIIKYKSEFIASVKINPNQIEFLIHK